MFNRILLSGIAAATLLAAAPAFAADRTSGTHQCSCCSDGSIHDVDHSLREGDKQKGAEQRKAQSRTAGEDLDVRNQSWGG